jgi:hypothetical protein
MEQPTRFSFDGEEHPWQLPEMASKFKERVKYTDPKYHKSVYEEMVFADLLKKNPDFLIDDDLRVEDELNSPVDDLIDQTYAKRMLGRPLNKGEHAPEDYKYEWMAERIGFLSGAERTRDRLRGLADSLYNAKTIAENKSWDDARKAYGANPTQQSTPPQITSPSRSNMLKASGAEIDPNYPLFLQVADTNTQWSKDHPLRKRFLEEGPKIYSAKRFSKNLDILDRINGEIDEDTYIPSYIQEEIKKNPSSRDRLLRELTRNSYFGMEKEGKLDEE